MSAVMKKPNPAKRASEEVRHTPSGGAERASAEKLNFALIPPEFDVQLATVLTHGEHKYGAHNFEKGLPVGDLISSARRHIIKIQAGEIADASGCLHAAHGAWNLLALGMQEMRNYTECQDFRRMIFELRGRGGPGIGFTNALNKDTQLVFERLRHEGYLK